MKYLKEVTKIKENIVEDLQKLISFPTVYDSKTITNQAPFGKSISQALLWLKDKALADGFKVDFFDGYGLAIEYGEVGDLIIVAAHIDVVPASGVWEKDPYSGFNDGIFIHGRGSQDDKGPLVACYHALKLIKEGNLVKNSRIKLLIGGNEESGSKCLKYYFETLKKEQPKYAFTPDASFPLIYGEKGIITLRLLKNFTSQKIIAFGGGEASNSVAEEAWAEIHGRIDRVKFGQFLQSFEINGYIEEKKTSTRVVVKGLSSHGSTPELGKNAIAYLLIYLAKEVDETLFPIAHLCATSDGVFLGIKSYGEELKDLTVNLGLASYKDSFMELVLNIRYPETTNKDDIISKMKNKLDPLEMEIEVLNNSPMLLIDKNSHLVEVLLKSYQYFTNDLSKPFTIGGGTYARHMKNCVAFGMQFKETPSLMHQSNERISIADLLKGTAIYLKALVDLDEK